MDKCLICSSPDTVRYRYGNHLNKINISYAKHLAGSFAAPFLLKFSSGLKYKLLFSPLYRIVKCNSCGYGHYERQISPDDLENYYKSVYWQAEGLSSTNDESEFLDDDRANGQYIFVQDELQRISEHGSFGILEIGAGSALASRMIQYKHPMAIPEVVEPGFGWDKYYRDHAINKVASYFPFHGAKKYSYIHTSHWLEHVLDIHRVIKNIREMLQEGGIIFVEVPNCTKDYWGLDVGDIPHIHFFTESALVNLFRTYHFEMVKTCAVGFTNRESLAQSNGIKPDPNACNEAIKSVRHSVSRQGGESLRMLFRKIE